MAKRRSIEGGGRASVGRKCVRRLGSSPSDSCADDDSSGSGQRKRGNRTENEFEER